MGWWTILTFCGIWISGFAFGQAWERKKWLRRLRAVELPPGTNPKLKPGDLLIVLREKK